jgi:hypothetical protein
MAQSECSIPIHDIYAWFDLRMKKLSIRQAMEQRVNLVALLTAALDGSCQIHFNSV